MIEQFKENKYYYNRKSSDVFMLVNNILTETNDQSRLKVTWFNLGFTDPFFLLDQFITVHETQLQDWFEFNPETEMEAVRQKLRDKKKEDLETF